MANIPPTTHKHSPGYFSGSLYQEAPFILRPLGPYNFVNHPTQATGRPHYMHTHAVNFSNMLNIHRCLYRLVNCYYTDPTTARFILRAPRNTKETPFGRDQRYISALNRFIELSVRDIIHAETQLPKPKDSPRVAMGMGRDVLPGVPWAEYKTNLSLALEIAYFCIITEMATYMHKKNGLPLAPLSHTHILYKWQRLRILGEKAVYLALLSRRAQLMEFLKRPIVFQDGYSEWWNKLTARATWMEMVQSAKNVPLSGIPQPAPPPPSPFKLKTRALGSHNPEVRALGDLLQTKKVEEHEQAERAQLGLKNAEIQWWLLSHIDRAVPPTPQLGIPKDEDEVAVPVIPNGPQISHCLEEGRAVRPLLGEMVMLGLEMMDTSAIESGEQPWWEHIIHKPSQDEALEGVVDRVVEDILNDLKPPSVSQAPKAPGVEL